METALRQSRRTHSAEERAALLETYSRSGIPQKRWCKENGIAVSTLGKWLKQDKKQVGTHIMQTWAPFATVPQVKEDTLLVQAGKFSIAVGKSTDIELLSAVLNVLVTLC